MRRNMTRAQAGGLVLLASILGVLLPLAGYPQGLSDTWDISTYYPSPLGRYHFLACSEFQDYSYMSGYDTGDNLKLDPDGTSRLRSMQISGEITMQLNSLILGYEIDDMFINLSSTAMPVVKLPYIVTIDRIMMGGEPGNKLVADIAEGMEYRGSVEKGDVVIIEMSSGKIERSANAYDIRVAGVISSDPSVYLAPGEGRQPLSLSGVVRCKVSAENGAIQPGDLLVSANTPGHAMRASLERIHVGMVVGKALEGLASGVGTIHILVNKQ